MKLFHMAESKDLIVVKEDHERFKDAADVFVSLKNQLEVAGFEFADEPLVHEQTQRMILVDIENRWILGCDAAEVKGLHVQLNLSRYFRIKLHCEKGYRPVFGADLRSNQQSAFLMGVSKPESLIQNVA